MSKFATSDQIVSNKITSSIIDNIDKITDSMFTPFYSNKTGVIANNNR